MSNVSSNKFFYPVPFGINVPENLEEILTAYYQEVNPEKVSGVYPLGLL